MSPYPVVKKLTARKESASEGVGAKSARARKRPGSRINGRYSRANPKTKSAIQNAIVVPTIMGKPHASKRLWLSAGSEPLTRRTTAHTPRLRRTENGLSAWMCRTVSPISRRLMPMSAAPTGTASQASQSISAVSGQRRVAHWRRRLERRRSVRDLELHVPGAARTYLVAIPADPDAVLDELASPEPHMPYWATPWPSGLALAEVALARRERVAGRRVLELGCGLGTTATALAECGSSPLGVDCFAEALAYARYNVARNTGRTLRTQ